jgi:DNA-binding response OmpR family regulator
MNERILIVEDEKDVVKLLKMVLENAGYHCYDVANGDAVFNFLDNQAVDVVILDIILPGIDGYEVCRRLKTRRQTNMIPIIMLTARAFPEDIIMGLSVGADKYLTKPFDHDILLEEIDKQIQLKQALLKKGVTGDIEFHILSDQRYLEQLNDMATMLFAHTPLTEKDITDIRYVLAEMGKNAIEWGNKNRKELPIRVHYRTDRSKLTIQIKDQGSGFNFQRYLDSSYNPSGEYSEREATGKRSGGLGIMLARVYMDEIEYNDSGNEVSLIRYFPQE